MGGAVKVMIMIYVCSRFSDPLADRFEAVWQWERTNTDRSHARRGELSCVKTSPQLLREQLTSVALVSLSWRRRAGRPLEQIYRLERIVRNQGAM